MHEVGHTLGLTHNFRASTVYTEAQLADPEFTRKNGIAGSVMEYNAVNLALPGEKRREYHMSTLGPYDYWAIEFGYREIAPDKEAEGARTHRRTFAASPCWRSWPTTTLYYSGLDPIANTFDLGAGPAGLRRAQPEARARTVAAHRVAVIEAGRNLLAAAPQFFARTGRSPGERRATRSSTSAASHYCRTTRAAAATPLEPVPADKQRAALKLLAVTIFAADSFKFQPSFLRRLAVSDADIADARDAGPQRADRRHRRGPAGACPCTARCWDR